MREGYESLTARRRWVVVVFGAIVTACLVAVWFSFSELNMIDRIESGALVGDDEIAALDGIQEVVRCGRGLDRADVDDNDIVRDCEVVMRQG